MAERYEIKGRLGRGGIGAVYAAYDHHLGRDVAIKRLLPIEQTRLNETAEDTLESEAKALAALSHPNIVTIFEFDEDEQGPFVVFELIEGDTLKELIDEGALSEADFFEVADQILDALIAAQQMEILHRDIKPANVMLSWLPSGKFQIKMLDFGLAKFAEEPSLQTLDQCGSFLGSIDYIAPEQIELRPLDQRTDLYSLGCLLYFALTQRAPFTGASMAETMSNHLSNKVVPLEQVRPDVSIAVSRWVMSLIKLDPSERPQDARAAMDSLNVARETTNASITDSIPTAKTVVPVVTTAQPIMLPKTLEDTQQIVTARPPTAASPVPSHPNSSQPVGGKKKMVSGRYQPKEKQGGVNKNIVYALIGSTALLIGIFWIMIADARNDRIRSEKIAANNKEADQSPGEGPITEPLVPLATDTNPNPVDKIFPPVTTGSTNSGGSKPHISYRNSGQSHGLPALPAQEHLVSYFSLGGLFQNRTGETLSAPVDGMLVGALENAVSGAHNMHLLRDIEDESKTPKIGNSWGGAGLTLLCKPTQKLRVGEGAFKKQPIVSDKFTFAILYRIPVKAMGNVFRAYFANQDGVLQKKAMRLAFTLDEWRLVTGEGYDNASKVGLITGRYGTIFIEYDGSTSEMTVSDAGRYPKGELIIGNSIVSDLKGKMKLLGFEYGHLYHPTEKNVSRQIETPAMSVHTTLLTDEEKRAVTNALFDGVFKK